MSIIVFKRAIEKKLKEAQKEVSRALHSKEDAAFFKSRGHIEAYTYCLEQIAKLRS